MKVLFVKTHTDAIMPTQAHLGDAGYDLYSVRDYKLQANKPTIVDIGLRIALPKGYYAEIHTRSSHGLKGIRNHLGIIDEGYRGPISPIMITNKDVFISKGSKVGQLIIRKRIEVEFEEVKELPESDRGVKGFGSSGR